MDPSMTAPVSTLTTGAGDLPKVVVVTPDGARAEVYLHGAHVTSWVPAQGEERLFLSRVSNFRTGAPIRGGIPVVFPQFGTTGPLPLHGLVRVMPWEFVGAEVVGSGATATFRVHDTEDSRRQWDHAFKAELTVALRGNQFAVTLSITNTGSEPFSFTGGFHTYQSVRDISQTIVEDLSGLRYRDAAAGGIETNQVAPHVEFTGEVNRIYFDAPVESRIVEPGRTTAVRKAGFPDAVVWNPAAAKGATMADLEPEDYKRFVCVEASIVGAPQQVMPGECWQGTQVMIA